MPTSDPSSPASTDDAAAGTGEAATVQAATAQATAEPTAEAVTTPVPVPAVPTGSRLDERMAALMTRPWLTRLWTWGAPAVVLLVAAVLRLWNLGHPHELVFDETYYVKDAYTLLHNGYESTWPDEPNERFNAGDTDIFGTDASYVVHPPLGKWLIALGLAVFGAGDSVGWRISTAVVGILGVALVMVAARLLLRSRLLTVVAGTLMAVDGHAIVMSRVAILDNSVMFFALLGFVFVLLDRRHYGARLAAAVVGSPLGTGPAIWWRPWLIAAGAAFGATTAVKWSGLYFLAAFGLYVVGSDILRRRRLGLPLFVRGALFTQGPVSFVLMVPVAAAVYLASWTGWFVTEGGYDRHWAEQPGNAATGVFSWIPLSLQSLLHYHQSAYSYHVGLDSPHTYQASPLGWSLLLRPTSMFYASSTAGEGDCAAQACSQAITSIGNPLIWWAGTAALFYLLYRYVARGEWTHGAILMGIVAGYLPWMMYLNRTVFQFYSIAFEPYLILALTAVIGIVVGTPRSPRHTRTSGLMLLAVFLAGVIVLSAFWYPLWTGMTVSYDFWHLHMWFPSWV
ncbi:dolichyl-phosphate-mannose--protein mannosyltransferase [Mycetocola reblochoni]|uniref:Polyprenol-phosphate-mannose--protein mannosyltransferase n=2 Tax=Mycetocola reblochoni TaxID=331618 RepID=A0A1R4JGW7_9MICO|nr:phospholipid carrier-dependent glycosyltransferase [Mycetocola reblochoni]SJN31174.1 CONSERVED MEMBRANE PROTEIN [Mycetocola reblochoni REB411]